MAGTMLMGGVCLWEVSVSGGSTLVTDDSLRHSSSFFRFSLDVTVKCFFSNGHDFSSRPPCATLRIYSLQLVLPQDGHFRQVQL